VFWHNISTKGYIDFYYKRPLPETPKNRHKIAFGVKRHVFLLQNFQNLHLRVEEPGHRCILANPTVVAAVIEFVTTNA
jgi:hypothetical protein